MKNTLFIGTFLLLVILSGGFYFWHNKNEETIIVSKPITSEILTDSWVEVISTPVFAKTVGQGREIPNGEIIKSGTAIETGNTGSATLHLPDGSLIRLDKNSSITLSLINYEPSTKSLIADLNLSFGRAWMKVVDLATAGSRFTIKTDNSVTSVIGTAFAVGFLNNHTWVLSSEHSVKITPLDPISKDLIPNNETTIDEGKYIDIGIKDIKDIIATSTNILSGKVQDPPQSLMKDLWITESKKKDSLFNSEISNLKAKTGGDTEFRNKLEAANSKTQANTGAKSEDNSTNKEEPSEKKNTSSNTSSTNSGGSYTNKPSNITADNSGAEVFADNSLGVTSDSEILAISEGGSLKFKATAINKNGEKVDVSEKVIWVTLGSIGSVSQNGLFSAKLGSDVSELGKAVGFVIATIPSCSEIKTEKLCSKTKQISQSGLITISAVIPPPTTNIGGQ